jgi:8-oxo-dGTP pyrophosphatase MutT (NUDIX family)
MKLVEFVFENDIEHQRELERTGFWGKRGAGCLFQAIDTGRICIAHRSNYVEQPNTWGTWGGAIDDSESPELAAKREAVEESGYVGKMKLIPLYVFKHSSGFVYHNFLALVESEFKPTLDWETQGYKWVQYGNWPSPLHNGLKLLLNDQTSLSILQKYSK